MICSKKVPSSIWSRNISKCLFVCCIEWATNKVRGKTCKCCVHHFAFKRIGCDRFGYDPWRLKRHKRNETWTVTLLRSFICQQIMLLLSLFVRCAVLLYSSSLYAHLIWIDPVWSVYWAGHPDTNFMFYAYIVDVYNVIPSIVIATNVERIKWNIFNLKYTYMFNENHRHRWPHWKVEKWELLTFLMTFKSVEKNKIHLNKQQFWMEAEHFSSTNDTF